MGNRLDSTQKTLLHNAIEALKAGGGSKIKQHKGDGLEISSTRYGGKPAVSVKCNKDLFPYVEGFGGNHGCTVRNMDNRDTEAVFTI